MLDGVYFERLISNAKGVDEDLLIAREEQELLTISVGTPTLIQFESEKPLEQLIAGDKITINRFAISFRGSYTFQTPMEFIIPHEFTLNNPRTELLTNHVQQEKINNLRLAINNLKNYGELLALITSRRSPREAEYVFQDEIDLKVRKGVEVSLLANQLNRKLDLFLLTHLNPNSKDYEHFVKDMKTTLHHNDELFSTHRNELTLILRDILLALTVIAPIVWISKAIYSSLTTGNYSLFKNNTQTQHEVNNVDSTLMCLS